MSTTTSIDTGGNISNAVFVLRETYKNLNLLFSELDRIGEKEGFVSITPKFLRWKSDSDNDGWLTSNFIKLYQLEKDDPLPNFENMRDGYIYGVEVDLEGEDNYPTISLAKYHFDFSEWSRTPGISDHWVFWGAFRLEKFFDIRKEERVWTSKTAEKAKSRYWGLQSAVATDIPLVSINSSEEIKAKIFQAFENLPMI